MDNGAILLYLEQNVKDFKVNKRGKFPIFTCPHCNKMETARFVPGADKINCMACNYTGDIHDIACLLGNVDYTDTKESIMDKICADLDIQNDSKIIKTLEYYKANKFDLTPLQHNSKIPFELDWLNKEHKDDDEWFKWLSEMRLNIGVKTGSRSGITIIDVDQETIPADIELLKGNPLIQKTGRGWHLIYKYSSKIPTTKIAEYKVDLLNDGKQAVLYPSDIVNADGSKNKREFITELIPLTDIPEDLLRLLLSKLEPTAIESKQESLEIDPNFKVNLTDLTLKNNNLEGCCNDTFLKLGGILSKQLKLEDNAFALRVLNQHLLEKPLDNARINNIIKSLSKYTKKDEKALAQQIFKYLNIVEFANSKEIKDALGFSKEDIDKTLAQLVIEGYIIRKGRTFSIIKKANWKQELNISYNILPFDVPYFSNSASLAWGDMILLASKTKYGKTTVAMNIIKYIKEELVKKGLDFPIYYIGSEAGSRFVKTAGALGLVEGDFKWDFIVDPTKITLEENAITILDWLMISDKSQTDSVFKHFADQLYKTQGLLIAFQQLKENGDYFAENMAKQYPALSARYLYTDETGLKGNWILDAIREPKTHCKSGIIPCTYNTHTKVLSAD